MPVCMCFINMYVCMHLMYCMYACNVCMREVHTNTCAHAYIVYFYLFIYSGYFYGTSSSPLLFRGAPDYSIDTMSELTIVDTNYNYEADYFDICLVRCSFLKNR